MPDYDIVWEGSGSSSADSMPLGGYDVGCNVWTQDNKVYAYLSENGAFDENGTLLKLCRICLETDPGLMEARVRQTLFTEKGFIRVELGGGDDRARYDLWCATDKPELHVDCEFSKPHALRLGVDCWRYRDRPLEAGETHQCRDYQDSPDIAAGNVYTRKDTAEVAESGMYLYHRNPGMDELREKLIALERAGAFRESIPDPLSNLTSGCHITCGGMKYAGAVYDTYAGTDFVRYSFETPAVLSQAIVAGMRVSQEESVEAWKARLAAQEKLPAVRAKAENWWKAYFAKSYIHIDEAHPGSDWWKIGRNYQLFRYMLGCNYYGRWPTKFNGGLFTFDEKYTPDFRMWSGTGFTAQNQRLVYWPMLKTGDFEAMQAQFDYYLHIAPVALARTKHFYGHNGAFYSEQGNVYGLSIGMEYNWRHSPELTYAEIDNPWVKFHYSTGLEFALMILEYHRYSGRPIDRYMEFVESTVDFYAEHYKKNYAGRYFIFPSTALETYKGDPDSKLDEEFGCADPTDAVAGLRCVSRSLVEYYGADPVKKAHFQAIYDACPEVAYGREGPERKEYYLPARTFSPTPFNCELPQLYLIFPYSPRGLSDTEKERGRNAYLRPYPEPAQYLGMGWHQNGIFAARLGLKAEAVRYLHIKLDDAGKRFPAFWGPGHDWTPDHNHGGSGMILLQEMLMQLDGDEPVLLPAWDMDVDVEFRLFIPGGRTVSCVYKSGRIVSTEIKRAAEQEDPA